MCPGSTPGRTGVDFEARALVRAEEVMREAMERKASFRKTKELRFWRPVPTGPPGTAPRSHWERVD